MQMIAKNNHSLVKASRKQILADSLTVAEKFGKRHDNVVQKIENLIKDDESTRLNFKVSEYRDSTGRTLKMYTMDRRTFSILVMGFTGKKAMEWKHRFFDAFESMEKALLRQQNLEWKETRLIGRGKRRELTDSIKKVVNLAKSQGSKNADRYYTTFTNMIYRQAFELKSVPDNFRDSLDETTLKKLRLIEEQAAMWIDETVAGVSDYHDVYPSLKLKIGQLVGIMRIAA